MLVSARSLVAEVGGDLARGVEGVEVRGDQTLDLVDRVQGGEAVLGAGDVQQRLGDGVLQALRQVRTEGDTVVGDLGGPGEDDGLRADLGVLLDDRATGVVERRRDGRVTTGVIEAMRRETRALKADPDAVFFYSFIQARASA